MLARGVSCVSLPSSCGSDDIAKHDPFPGVSELNSEDFQLPSDVESDCVLPSDVDDDDDQITQAICSSDPRQVRRKLDFSSAVPRINLEISFNQYCHIVF